ncbi:hypothetical protein M0R72_20525 [Candidatus Pacearchaeota archaeon]|jgi:hypothetical protein|nr:hypothetical protein [Candidatus Pacearchaeota archaeon]
MKAAKLVNMTNQPFGLYARWDGGPLEVAKAQLSGWYYMRDPQAVEATANWYQGAESIALLLGAGINTIWVTWSVGFSPRTEAPQQEQLRRFITECRTHGISVHAYMSMCNMFREDMTVYCAKSQDWLQCDLTGKPVPYGAAIYSGEPTRLLACLNHPDWRNLLLKRCEEAMAAGCDGLEYDNQWTACRCKICTDKWTAFSVRYGEGVALPWPDAAEAAAWPLERRILLYAISDCFRQAEYEEIYKLVAERFPGGRVYGNFNPLYQCFSFPCNSAVSTENGREPGLLNGWVQHNAGLLLGLAGAAVDGRPVYCEYGGGHGRGKLHKRIAEAGVGATRFVPMEPVKHQLSIAEAAAYGVRFEVTPEGEFLRDLYYRRPEAMANWQAISKYGRFIVSHPEIYDGVRSVAKIVSLHATKCLRLRNDDVAQRPALLGELARHGVTLDVRYDCDLPGLSLEGYEVMLFADVWMMNDDMMAAAEAFLAGGGKVVATGSSGDWDGLFRRRADNRLRSLPGVIWLEDPGREPVSPNPGQTQANVVKEHPEDPLPNLDLLKVEVLAARLRELCPEPFSFEKPPTVLTRLARSGRGELLVHILNYDDTQRPDIIVRLPEDATAYWLTPDSPEGGCLLPKGAGEWLVQGMKTYGVVVCGL